MTSITTFAYKGTAPGQASYLYDKLLDNPPHLLSVDVETRSLKDRTIVGIGFGLSPIEAIYVPAHSPEFSYSILMLCDPGITKVYHNVMFDLPILFGYCPEIDTNNVLDTMLMCNMEGLPQQLGDIADVFGRKIKKIKDILPARTTMDQLPDDVVADKCLDDCMATMLVYKKLWPLINQEYFKKEMLLIPVLMAMTRRGIKLDQQRRQEIEDILTPEVELYRSLAEAEGFNPGSPQQVAYILMQRGNRIPVNRKNGKYSASTDEEVLKRIDDPMAALVLNYRKVSKQLSTYIIPYRGQDRAHTRFHLNAATGRISSAKPNMQNIPAGPGEPGRPGLRTMFLPDSGTWTDLDYSQQELRTLAYISQDSKMLDIFERGQDIHQQVADFMGIPRKVCKNVNFAAVYGASDETIMETAGITSLQKAHEVGVMWRTMFPAAARWIRDIQGIGIAQGYVSTIQGRKLWLPGEFEEREGDRRRKAVNYPIQASAAEITKAALLSCYRQRYNLSLQVHDELVIDGRVEEEELRGIGLEELAPFRCPIDIKYHGRWQ